MDAGTEPSKVAIYDKFSEQHQHQSIKSTIFNAQAALLVQIRCRLNFSCNNVMILISQIYLNKHKKS